MGLKGDDLKEFVKEKQAIARADRDRDKEARLSIKEIEIEKERMRVTEATLRLELQAKTSSRLDLDGVVDETGENAELGATHNLSVKGPKMALFDERDVMDSYLHRFERYADLQGWKKEAWVIYLATLLKGQPWMYMPDYQLSSLEITKLLKQRC